MSRVEVWTDNRSKSYTNSVDDTILEIKQRDNTLTITEVRYTPNQNSLSVPDDYTSDVIRSITYNWDKVVSFEMKEDDNESSR